MAGWLVGCSRCFTGAGRLLRTRRGGALWLLLLLHWLPAAWSFRCLQLRCATSEVLCGPFPRVYLCKSTILNTAVALCSVERKNPPVTCSAQHTWIYRHTDRSIKWRCVHLGACIFRMRNCVRRPSASAIGPLKKLCVMQCEWNVL